MQGSNLKRRRAQAAVLALAIGVAPMSQLGAAGPGTQWRSAVAASPACNALSTFGTETGLLAGETNGMGGTFFPGDIVTITVGLETATSSSVSIVGNAAPTPLLAGPLIGPGTLTYEVTGALPPGSIGIGFFVNSTTPQNGTVSVNISCRDIPRVVPVWSGVAAAVTIGLLGLIGWRRRNRA